MSCWWDIYVIKTSGRGGTRDQRPERMLVFSGAGVGGWGGGVGTEEDKLPGMGGDQGQTEAPAGRPKAILDIVWSLPCVQTMPKRRGHLLQSPQRIHGR